MTTALEGVSGQQHAPAALYPRGRPGTHFTGGWVGPRTCLDGRKNLVPTGIRSRTVQPVVSRYNDWATGPTYITSTYCSFIKSYHQNCLDDLLIVFNNISLDFRLTERRESLNTYFLLRTIFTLLDIFSVSLNKFTFIDIWLHDLKI